MINLCWKWEIGREITRNAFVRRVQCNYKHSALALVNSQLGSWGMQTSNFKEKCRQWAV